jgi:hypothetical protein
VSSAALEQLTERDWQRQVVQLAQQLGWRVYHTHDSRRSAEGFPDLVLVRDRVVFAELKREPRVAVPVTAEQREWLAAIDGAGCEAYLWRPSDLDDVARVLSRRRSA